MMWRRQLVHVTRKYSTAPPSLFAVFPQNYPHGGPPHDPFHASPKLLRREYRHLQSTHHPDVARTPTLLAGPDADNALADINRAYTTLRNPYSRIAHFVELHHPRHLDITHDEVAKSLIAHFQTNSPLRSLEYKDMLMTVMEAHEVLEMATHESELDELAGENDARIAESERLLDVLVAPWPHVDWDDITMEAIRLKYWVNIQNGIKEWEPGKQVHLTH